MKLFDWYMVREPILNINDLKIIKKNNLNDDEYLNMLITFIFDKGLDVCLCHANIELFSIIKNYQNINLSKKKKKNLSLSLYNYITRMILRSTPFGFMSSINIKALDTTNPIWNNYAKKYNLEIDSRLLYPLINKLNIVVKNELYLKKNSNVYEDTTHFYIPYQMQLEGTNTVPNNISVKKNELSKFIFTKLNNMLYKDLVKLVEDEFDADTIMVETYLDKLIEENFIVTELEDAISHKDRDIFLIKKLEQKGFSNSYYYKALKEIYDIRQIMEKGNIHDDILYRIIEVKKFLKEKFNLDVLNIFKVDTIDTNIEIDLSKSEINNIKKVIDMLLYLPSDYDNSLQEYKNKFLEIYGQDEYVNILKLLNKNTGIQYPINIDNNKAFQYNNEKVYSLLTEWQYKAIRDKTDIILNEERIELLKRVGKKPIDKSFDMVFTVTKDGFNNNIYHLNDNVTSLKATNIYGRFRYLNTKYFEEQLNKFPDSVGVPSDNLNYHHPNPIIDNVKFKSIFFDKQTSFTDIFVFLGEDLNFYLKNLKNGETFIPKISDMHNTQYSPNLIDFLSKVENQFIQEYWNIENYLSDYTFLPRIVYKNIIISPRKWKINFLEKIENYSQFIKIFLAKKDELLIPNRFYIQQADLKIYIDLENERCMEILFKESKKNISIIIVEIEKNLLQNKKVKEAVFSIKSDLHQEINYNYMMKKDHIPNLSKEILYIDDGWISVNLYYNDNNINKFIGEFFLTNIFESENFSDIKYFIRYADEKEHIRLRMKLEFDQVKSALHLFKEMVDLNYIIDYKIVPYYRETYRYGGKEVIEIVEACFEKDSEIVSKFYAYSNISSKEKLYFNILNIFDILSYFSESINDKITFFKDINHKVQNKKIYRKYKDNLLKTLNGSYEENYNSYLSIRRKEYQKLKEALKYEEVNYKKSIILSIVHMFNNRLSGINREHEELVMEFASRTLIDYQNMRKYL